MYTEFEKDEALESKVFEPLMEFGNSPFNTEDAINLSETNWVRSNVQLAQEHPHAADHTTYQANGTLVHFKSRDRDGIYEALYEPVTYELGVKIGLNYPSTTVGYYYSNNALILGTLSHAIFTESLQTASTAFQTSFFNSMNPTAFIGETVAAVWYNNWDWSGLNYSNIIVGKTNTGSSAYYFIDKTHIFKGPLGSSNLSQFSMGDCFWWDKGLKIGFTAYARYIERVEKLTDIEIREICNKWANKIAKIDFLNSYKYLKMAEDLAGYLIRRKFLIRDEFQKYFSSQSLTT